MADIKLVIKIPEEVYERFGHEYSEENLISKYTNDVILESFCNGTLLPKGHGDLIDRNGIEYLKAIHDLKWGKITASECAKKIKYSAPTIIKADTESEVNI